MTEERVTYTTQLEARIAELEADIARLEQDNKRLRWLDSMPVDAMRRQFLNSLHVNAVDTGTYDPTQADDVERWHHALRRAARRRERREQAMYRAMMTENNA